MSQHRHGRGVTVALLMRRHLIVMPSSTPPRLITSTGSPAWPRHRRSCTPADLPGRPQRLPDLSSLRRVWRVVQRRATRSGWLDPTRWARRHSGRCTAAPSYRPWRCSAAPVAGAPRLGRPGGRRPDEVLDDQTAASARRGQTGEIFMQSRPGSDPPTVTSGPPPRRMGGIPLGDLGHFDQDGYLYLSDRRVDMFTVGSREHLPRAEIEGNLCAHPDVLSCLVVGVPHDDLGRSAMPHDPAGRGADLDADGVQAFLRSAWRTGCPEPSVRRPAAAATTPARPGAPPWDEIITPAARASLPPDITARQRFRCIGDRTVQRRHPRSRRCSPIAQGLRHGFSTSAQLTAAIANPKTRVSARITTMSPSKTNRPTTGNASPARPGARRTAVGPPAQGHHHRAAQDAVSGVGTVEHQQASSTPASTAPIAVRTTNWPRVAGVSPSGRPAATPRSGRPPGRCRPSANGCAPTGAPGRPGER